MNSVRPTYHHGNLRDAVLLAAERALVAGGVESVSLREIGRELGVSHTAPRHHFPSRQSLLDALAVHGYHRLGVVLARAAGSDLPFDERLGKVARAIARFARRHPALLAHMFAVKHHPDAAPEVLEAANRVLASGPQLMRQGQETGAVIPGDPEELALLPFALVQGLVSLASNGMVKDVPLEQAVDRAMRRIILGLRPRP